MNDYTGKICPYCKTEFKPDDEVVVCSACEMPHHKDCWVENQGCTTFGCLGTIQSANVATTAVTSDLISYDAATEIVSDTVFCTQCGARNSKSYSFCSNCGNKLVSFVMPEVQAPVYNQADPYNSNPYAYVNTQESVNYTAYNQQSAAIDPLLAQMVGTKQEYYVPKFQQFIGLNKKTSWNWAAFLFAPYWMIYRKMYAPGAAVIGIAFVLSLFQSTFCSLLSLAGYIAIGIFGNFIYMEFLKKKATQANAMVEPYKAQYIAQNTGTNSTVTTIVIVVYALFTILLNL